MPGIFSFKRKEKKRLSFNFLGLYFLSLVLFLGLKALLWSIYNFKKNLKDLKNLATLEK